MSFLASKSGTAENLRISIERLAEKLEDEPDPWFSAPRGFLKKPAYGRAAQERSAVLKRTNFSSILSSGYQIRYFVVDIKGKKAMYFKNDDPSAVEKGNIDMTKIVDVQYSQVFDAPEFSLDLISKDRHYTVVCESHDHLVRWAFAFNLARPSTQIDNGILYDIVYDPTSKVEEKQDTLPFRWSEYEVVFEDPAPLMMNLVGMINRDKEGKFVNNLLAVTSFDFYPDGSSGVSEMTGMIGVKDYLIRVNDIDLTKFAVTEAMNHLASSKWPKTLHFLRDNLGSRDGPKIEGWTFAYYPKLPKQRLRYIELVHDTINFFRAEPGGTVKATKSCSFNLSQVAVVKPIINLRQSQTPCSLLLVCKPGAIIKHYRPNDEECTGATYVDTLELHYQKMRQLNRWRSALVSPVNIFDGTSFCLVADPVQTII